MSALGLHAALLQDLVRYKRKLFAIKGSILYGFKQGVRYITEYAIFEFVISGVDCTWSSVFYFVCQQTQLSASLASQVALHRQCTGMLDKELAKNNGYLCLSIQGVFDSLDPDPDRLPGSLGSS